MSYSTQEELEVYLAEITRETVSIMLPYMDVMEENYVETEPLYWKLLSDNPSGRAKRFAERYGLDRMDSQENLQKIDAIMRSWQSGLSCRKKDFHEHVDDIIDLAAYFGEFQALNKRLELQWKWEKYGTKEIFQPAGIVVIDPLTRVIDSWNFGAEIKNYSLRHFCITIRTQEER